MLSFFEGFLLGLGAAVPLGPINILIMNEAIKEYKSAVMIGLGAMSSDVIYLFLIMLGLVAFFNQYYVLNSLSFFGAIFLIYLAYAIFKSRNERQKTSSIYKKSSYSKLYIKGLTLTFVNPYSIGFWLSVSGFVASKELEMFVTLFGMLSAIALWIIIMPYLVHKSKHRISSRVSYWINIVSAVILLGFGLTMFLNLFSQMEF
ncbi:LysE family translocator [Sulfurimonas hongkongensis]|nr:LysE family translocator [Sulfurimonas hongkongensis]